MVGMRLVFCGSGDCGIPTLKGLVPGGHEIPLVITQPPRPAGRGGKLRPTPVAEVAEGLGLNVLAVEDINAAQCVEVIQRARPEVILVIDFGQKIGAEVRGVARHGAINMHGSLLPKLRGAAPANWAIIRGHTRTGVTTFRMVDRMDAGAVLCQSAIPVGPDETADELRARLGQAGREVVAETLDMLEAGPCEGSPQDESQATAAPRLKKSDGLIDWSADAVTIRNLIHGTWPWPGGQANYVGGEGKSTPVVIARAAAIDPDRAYTAPGEVAEDLTVLCGRGRLEIRQIRPAGRRLIRWRDFVNGYRVRAGTKFTAVGK